MSRVLCILACLLIFAGCEREDGQAEQRISKQTQLSRAISTGDLDRVKEFVEKGWDPNSRFTDTESFPCSEHYEGGTVLHFLALNQEHYREKVEFLKYLVSKGADINARDNCGRTPLYVAVENLMKNGDMSEVFVSLGADVNLADNEGISPLHLACMNACAGGLVDFLIEHGADVNAKNKRGFTPLDYTYDDHDKTHILLNKGAESGETHRDQLIQAVIQNDLKKLEALSEVGANLMTRDGTGRTLLHFTTKAEIAAFLISKGLDANATDEDGWTPLHNAHNSALIKTLVDGGAKPDVIHCHGTAPIHNHVTNNRLEQLKLLVSLGADVDLKMKSPGEFYHQVYGWVGTGGTALHIAAVAGYDEAVEVLVELGADVNATDKDGKTPLDLAKKDEIIRFLKTHDAKTGRELRGEDK